MIIVSDTTPIIILFKIKQLDLLQKLFENIIIPRAVYDELTSNAQFQEEAKVIKDAEYIILKSWRLRIQKRLSYCKE